jgi:hypothetical protein
LPDATGTELMMSIFESARLKVKRANRHIGELETTITSYAANLYELRPQYDPQANVSAFTIHVAKPFPDDIGPIIGDAAHNLRSALDHLFAEAVGSSLRKKDRMFPFHQRKRQVETDPRLDAIEIALPGAKWLILDEVQPYEGGNGDLYALNLLDRIDKHNKLIITAYVGLIHHLELTYAGGGGITFAQVRFNLDQDTLLTRAPGRLTLQYKSESGIEISFGQSLPFESEPVVPTLVNLSQRVAETIEAFAALIT